MYSFDVFDTIITRITATPQGIFALMSETLVKDREKNGLTDYVIDNFFELRLHSEELIRKSKASQNVEEVSLQDIYTAMAVCGLLNEKQIDYLYCLEVKLELASVVGIPENIERIKNLLQQGERVVLISDMYLPADVIRRMLMKIDLVFEDIPLYVSSEYGVRKTTGNLYRKVQEEEQACYEEWTHIGDNMYQDIEIPYRLGIRVEIYSYPGLTDFEKKVLKNYGYDSKIQLMIGTAVWAERERIYRNDNPGYGIAGHIGNHYAGPVLYSYAEWILEQAEARKLKRLYFIARDGYLVKKIVDTIIYIKKINLKTYYIYGSRKVWRMPSLSDKHYNLYQMIIWSHICRIRSLRDLAEILHIPCSELYNFLPGTYRKDKENDIISMQELEFIVRRLEKDERFRRYHLHELKNERKIVKQYLRQEIDTSDDDFAFVDVSGGGLTQGCLYELLKEWYPKPIYTFFFKVDRVNLIEKSKTITYIPSFLENNLTIEMMCRAPHGQTKGYTIKEGKCSSILEDTEVNQLISHDFYGYEKGILEFTHRMCAVSEVSGRKISSIRNMLLYIQHIAKEPSKEVLEYFASMPSNETGRGKDLVEYAPRLTEHEIREIFLHKTNEPIEFYYKGTDLNYSIMRAEKAEKMLINQCRKEHDSTLGRLYRQDKERKREELYRCYGRAAFYPVRLLEERLVLYGAGKFGQDLYKRLKEDGEHEVALWVDKNAYSFQQKGLTEVREVSEIKDTGDEQIVIAVMNEEIADEIIKELELSGILRNRIVWIKPYTYPDAYVEWKTEKIG